MAGPKFRNILPATLWLLKQSPEIVRELPREGDLAVLLGNSEKLGLEKVRLLVPQGIVVYHVTVGFRNKGELLFTAQEGLDMGPAFLSVVTKQGRGLNYAKNMGELLKYPWLCSEDSGYALHRLKSTQRNAVFYGRRPINHLPHPFDRSPK